MITWTDRESMLNWFGANSVAQLSKQMWKSSDSGIEMEELDDNTMRLSTIVEGSDAEFSETFTFPITEEQFDALCNGLEESVESYIAEVDDARDEFPDVPVRFFS